MSACANQNTNERVILRGEDYIFAHAKSLLMLSAVSANDGVVMICPAVPCSFVCT